MVGALLREAQASSEDHGPSIRTLEDLTTSFTADDTRNIYFHSDRIYRHGVFKIRYTTYDCRNDHDTLNASTSRRDCMWLQEDPVSEREQSESPRVESPVKRQRYFYGRLLGVFHTNMLYTGPGAFDFRKRRFDFLWIRRFVSDTNDTKPWTEKRLDTLSLVPTSQPDSCMFVDPSHILRAAHIVPRFSSGPLYPTVGDSTKGKGRLPLLSKIAKDQSDWRSYFVNR